MRGLARRNRFGRSCDHNGAAGIPAFRPQVDHPVGGLDHIQVMLDHKDCMAFCCKALKHFKKLFNILEMKSCRGFIQDEEAAAAAGFL